MSSSINGAIHASLLQCSNLCCSASPFLHQTRWGSPSYTRKQLGLHQDLSHVYDYVIIGGGPGGLTMANRLTEDANTTVAIVEAGTWVEIPVVNLTEVPAYDFSFEYSKIFIIYINNFTLKS